MTTPAIHFYGDLNCPFCFAENERLLGMPGSDRIDWRGIEHMPDIPAPWGAPDANDATALTEEIARLRERAPEIEITQPRQRPSSNLGTITVAELGTTDPSAATQLRNEIYRALWRDGRDISDPAVIADVCRNIGIAPVAPTRNARRLARVWTTEWANGPFNRRIPVLATDADQRLLGLAAPSTLETFLADPTTGAHGTDVCRA